MSGDSGANNLALTMHSAREFGQFYVLPGCLSGR